MSHLLTRVATGALVLALLLATPAASAPLPLPPSGDAEPLDSPSQDVVADARRLAQSGQRAAAMRMLVDRLLVNPGDLDARTLLGTVLLWEGRYDEARAELDRVLAVDADYIDALGAKTNLELWTGHHAAAEALSGRVLQRTPNDTSILLARARALDNLDRPKEAEAVLTALLAIEPDHAPARQMRERIRDSFRHWQIGYGYGYDWFSDGRDPWREHQIFMGRQNRWGSAIARASHADRYGREDQQIELDLYPSLRRGTYLYLNVGASTKQTIYPDYRWGVDWYQSLGAGLEASIGYHYLDFGDGVDIYIGSLSKYLGNWLFTGQVFVVPDAAGASRSYHGAFRRYFGDKQYVGLRYRRGVSFEEARTLDDILVLESEGASGEIVKLLGRRTELTLRGSWSRQEREFGNRISHYSTSASMAWRF